MPDRPDRDRAYVLDAQAGFVLRLAAQRHAVIFAEGVAGEVTPTQWAALARLGERGPLGQNRLGRLTGMDAATIKGVVDRLSQRGLVATRADPADGRRLLVDLSPEGRALVARLTPRALAVTEATLAPLDAGERDTLLRLLSRLR